MSRPRDGTPRLVVQTQFRQEMHRGKAPGIEELAAASDGSPALAGQHGEVGHRGEAADVGGADVVSAMTHDKHTNMRKNEAQACTPVVLQIVALTLRGMRAHCANVAVLITPSGLRECRRCVAFRQLPSPLVNCLAAILQRHKVPALAGTKCRLLPALPRDPMF